MRPLESQRNAVPIGLAVEILQREYPDVSHSSLRFLEREGLVVPARTAGGHRLYSSSDIQRLRQIKAWQEERLSLGEIRARLDALESVGSSKELAARFLELAEAGELESARRVILESSNLGLPLDTLFLDVLKPALYTLGEHWETGTALVAQEKEVSEVARELIAELTLRHAGTEMDAHAAVVAACVAHEEHDQGLRMLSGLLRSRNVPVHFLGPAVDPGFLFDSVRLRRARAVLLSVTLDEHLPHLHATVDALRGAGETARIFAGGQAIRRNPEILTDLHLEQTGDDIDDLASRLRG